MRNTFKLGGLVIALLGVATIVLLTTTLVLGITGATSATTWTGTIGVVLLAVWLVAVNGHRRHRRHRPAAAAPPPLTESTRL